jgi:hypothetical protein
MFGGHKSKVHVCVIDGVPKISVPATLGARHGKASVERSVVVILTSELDAPRIV